jgi:hypothetical protein
LSCFSRLFPSPHIIPLPIFPPYVGCGWPALSTASPQTRNESFPLPKRISLTPSQGHARGDHKLRTPGGNEPPAVSSALSSFPAHSFPPAIALALGTEAYPLQSSCNQPTASKIRLSRPSEDLRTACLAFSLTAGSQSTKSQFHRRSHRGRQRGIQTGRATVTVTPEVPCSCTNCPPRCYQFRPSTGLLLTSLEDPSPHRRLASFVNRSRRRFRVNIVANAFDVSNMFRDMSGRTLRRNPSSASGTAAERLLVDGKLHSLPLFVHGTRDNATDPRFTAIPQHLLLHPLISIYLLFQTHHLIALFGFAKSTLLPFLSSSARFSSLMLLSSAITAHPARIYMLTWILAICS